MSEVSPISRRIGLSSAVCLFITIRHSCWYPYLSHLSNASYFWISLVTFSASPKKTLSSLWKWINLPPTIVLSSFFNGWYVIGPVKTSYPDFSAASITFLTNFSGFNMIIAYFPNASILGISIPRWHPYLPISYLQSSILKHCTLQKSYPFALIRSSHNAYSDKYSGIKDILLDIQKLLGIVATVPSKTSLCSLFLSLSNSACAFLSPWLAKSWRYLSDLTHVYSVRLDRYNEPLMNWSL